LLLEQRQLRQLVLKALELQALLLVQEQGL